MDEETAKEVLGLQNQIKSILARKRQREDNALEEEVRELQHRLASSNKRKVEEWRKNKTLQAEILELDLKVKKQAWSVSTLEKTVKTLREENQKLKVKLEVHEKHRAAFPKLASELDEKLGLALKAVSES